MREERTADARIQGDETLVLLVEIALTKNLTIRAQIEAGVGAFHNPDVLPLGDLAFRVRLAVKDEDEISSIVETLLDKVVEVLESGGGLGEGVENEGPVFG